MELNSTFTLIASQGQVRRPAEKLHFFPASIVALHTSHPHIAAASPAAVEADAHQCCMLPLQASCAGNEHPSSQLRSGPTFVAQRLSCTGQAITYLQTLQSIAWAPGQR